MYHSLYFFMYVLVILLFASSSGLCSPLSRFVLGEASLYWPNHPDFCVGWLPGGSTTAGDRQQTSSGQKEQWGCLLPSPPCCLPELLTAAHSAPAVVLVSSGAITNDHRLGLKQQKSVSHWSGGQRAESKVLSGLVSSEASPLGFRMVLSSLSSHALPSVHLCVPISSSYGDTSYIA